MSIWRIISNGHGYVLSILQMPGQRYYNIIYSNLDLKFDFRQSGRVSIF